MEWFIAVVVVAALGVAAIVAAGGLGSMPAEPVRDVFRQDLPVDRSLTAEDLRRLRFGVAVRGYAMSQVDGVLDRLSGEVAERDRRIADLESLLAERGVIESPAGERPRDGLPRVDQDDREHGHKDLDHKDLDHKDLDHRGDTEPTAEYLK